MYDTKELKKKAEKSNVETIFIELVDQRDSGWVLDGTAGTSREVRLKCPSAEFIPNRGFRLVEGINPESGEKEWYNEEIRYIKNQRILSVAEQNAKGIKPSRARLDDKIIVKGGNAAISREGAYIGLYDYIMSVFYNQSNEKRPVSAKALFKIKDVTKEDEQFNESEVAYSDAVQYIKTLYRKQGEKFVYNEEKINAISNLLMIYAESSAGKISGLMGYAKRDAKQFLNIALKFEDAIVTNISHGLELSVIKFDGNTVAYCNKDKVIADLGRGNLSHDTKVNKLAKLFEVAEYEEVYKEFLVELSMAKEKQLSK